MKVTYNSKVVKQCNFQKCCGVCICTRYLQFACLDDDLSLDKNALSPCKSSICFWKSKHLVYNETYLFEQVVCLA